MCNQTEITVLSCSNIQYVVLYLRAQSNRRGWFTILIHLSHLFEVADADAAASKRGFVKRTHLRFHRPLPFHPTQLNLISRRCPIAKESPTFLILPHTSTFLSSNLKNNPSQITMTSPNRRLERNMRFVIHLFLLKFKRMVY